jgi:hypothetical protein
MLTDVGGEESAGDPKMEKSMRSITRGEFISGPFHSSKVETPAIQLLSHLSFFFSSLLPPGLITRARGRFSTADEEPS